MRKVSILTLSLGYGGIEKSAVSLANLLSKNNDVTIVSAYEIDKPVYDIERSVKILYLKKDLKPNDKVKESFRRHKYITYIKELLCERKVQRQKKKLMIDYIKKTDSDVIISTRNLYNLWLCKYGKKNVKKIGLDQHDFTDNKYVKKVLKYSKNLDYFVTVSEEQTSFYKQYFNDKVVYIPNFLEHSTFTSPLTEKRILFVGVLSKEKGIYDLIDVFKKVNQKHQDWVLDIVGGGTEYNNLLKKIEKENLNINLHGFKSQNYVERLYLNTSIYVMTSSKEVFNYTMLEAFSYGIPCVAFDRSIGCKSIISDNYDGYLVKYSDKDKMVRRINELIENRNRRIVMGRNACKKLLKYNKNEIKEKWEEIIN